MLNTSFVLQQDSSTFQVMIKFHVYVHSVSCGNGHSPWSTWCGQGHQSIRWRMFTIFNTYKVCSTQLNISHLKVVWFFKSKFNKNKKIILGSILNSLLYMAKIEEEWKFLTIYHLCIEKPFSKQTMECNFELTCSMMTDMPFDWTIHRISSPPG